MQDLQTLTNPFTGQFTKVMHIQMKGGQNYSVDVGSLFKEPHFFKPINKGYFFAINFWKLIGLLVFFVSVMLSFSIAWWVFILGVFVLNFIDRLNKKSVCNFVEESILENENVINYFYNSKLLWQ